MDETGQRNPHEVNVRWLRLVPLAGAVMLVVSLALYESPAPGSELFGPLDPASIRGKIWFEPLLASDWAASLNTVSALGYAGVGFGLQGRMRWRGVLTAFAIAGVLAAAGLGSLVYLMVTDSATFPLAYRGMVAIYIAHAVGAGGLALMWWTLRRAAMA